MPHGYRYHSSTDFLFPYAQSTVLPDPSRFLSPHLLSSPLPTNSFQNFVLNNRDQPEYIHPYLIKCFNSSLSMCFPSRVVTSSYIFQAFNADLTFSSPASNPSQNHIISSFDDLSVTLDLPPILRFFLVRGSPFVTSSTLNGPAPISISIIHTFLSIEMGDRAGAADSDLVLLDLEETEQGDGGVLAGSGGAGLEGVDEGADGTGRGDRVPVLRAWMRGVGAVGGQDGGKQRRWGGKILDIR